MMPQVAIATSSQRAADGGAAVAEAGGNAVDAAIAALLVQMVTEPGVVSIGGGAFLTIWPPQGRPVTVDGFAEMPGRGLPKERFGEGREVYLEYGGGVSTIIGHGSMATPGSLAALELASRRYGRVPWKALFEPAIEHARSGFPLPQAAYNYLIHAHELIYGWDPVSRSAIHDAHGELLRVGDTVRIADLDGTLDALAHEGARLLYEGELGALIADDSLEHGGLLTRDDLAAFEPIAREPLEVELGDWLLATNPPPAIGGAVLAALMQTMDTEPIDAWTPAELGRLIRVQRAVFEYRHEQIDSADEIEVALDVFLQPATRDALRARAGSPSTVHTSAVDDDGLACAVTSSFGYGSGVVPPGTGIWMNNFLGELELNRRGYQALDPGARLSSNMAPSVARSRAGALLALGSPGAGRIVTAIQQTLLNFWNLGIELADAVAHPRLHVAYVDERPRVDYEPGLAVDEPNLECLPYSELSMYFGGVNAALWEPGAGPSAAADPRREGRVAIAG